MITLNKPITVVCRMNREGDIKPFKFRLKEAGQEARTCYVAEVTDVRYGRYFGDETISYTCTTELDGDMVDCILMYRIDDTSWMLNKLHTGYGIAM